MTIDSTFLRSKLGRRIFRLFALCALSPMALLAVISLRNVTDQLRAQNRRELRRLSHEVGMNLCERLLFLEADLKLAEANLGAHGDHAIATQDLSSILAGGSRVWSSFGLTPIRKFCLAQSRRSFV